MSGCSAPAAREPSASGQRAGVVYWAPPEAAMRRAAEALREPLVSAYGPCGGMPALVAALKQKLADENGLSGVRPAARNTAAAARVTHERKRGSFSFIRQLTTCMQLLTDCCAAQSFTRPAARRARRIGGSHAGRNEGD